LLNSMDAGMSPHQGAMNHGLLSSDSFSASDSGSVRVPRYNISNYRNVDAAAASGAFSDSDSVEIRGIQTLPRNGGHGHSHNVDVSDSNSLLHSLMLVLALSVHSVFEGLALGLQPSTESVLKITAALFIHKSVLAFSLGLNLVQSGMKVGSIVRGNLIFSITSPLGIGIGVAIDHYSPYSLTTNLIDAILQGLACGTFIYVVFLEILPHELNSTDPDTPNRLLKVLLLIVGFSVIALLILILPDDVDPHHIGGDGLLETTEVIPKFFL